MTETDISNIKELVKKELVKSREEINRGILDSVRDLKKFIVIEEGTGRITILHRDKFKNTDKIVLIMLGKYIAHLGEIISVPEMTIQQMSDELGILKTTLSAPLGELIQKNILLKRDMNYRFNEAFIKDEIKKLLEKIQNE